MMGADHRIEQYLRPKCQYAQAIGPDGTIELLWQEVVYDPQRKEHKPHADALVHIVSLCDGLPQAILPPGQVGDRGDHQHEDECGNDVPAGNVDLMCSPLSDSAEKILQGQYTSQTKKGHDGPDVFTVFAASIVDACHEGKGAQQNGGIDKDQCPPSFFYAVKGGVAHPRDDIVSQSQHAKGGPSPEYCVGVYRTQTPKAEPADMIGIGSYELDTKIFSDGGADEQPGCCTADVPDHQPGKGGIDGWTTGRSFFNGDNRKNALAADVVQQPPCITGGDILFSPA